MVDAEPSFQVGALYTYKCNDGSWRILKVLAVDERTVHLRLYSNKFKEEPQDVDSEVLTVIPSKEPNGGVGIGHFPVGRGGFLTEEHVLIKIVPVKDDELEDYRFYLETVKGGR